MGRAAAVRRTTRGRRLGSHRAPPAVAATSLGWERGIVMPVVSLLSRRLWHQPHRGSRRLGRVSATNQLGMIDAGDGPRPPSMISRSSRSAPSRCTSGAGRERGIEPHAGSSSGVAVGASTPSWVGARASAVLLVGSVDSRHHPVEGDINIPRLLSSSSNRAPVKVVCVVAADLDQQLVAAGQAHLRSAHPTNSWLMANCWLVRPAAARRPLPIAGPRPPCCQPTNQLLARTTHAIADMDRPNQPAG